MAKEYHFEISRQERQTHLYQKILGHLKYTVSRDRAKNDGDLDMEHTFKMRGRLAGAKDLIRELESDNGPVENGVE